MNMPVDVRDGGATYCPARIVNVSEGGLLLETSRELPAGTEVEIVTPLIQHDHKIVVPARVVRLGKVAMGDEYRLALELLSSRTDISEWQEFVRA